MTTHQLRNWSFIAACGMTATMAPAAEFGSHELTLQYTPLAQWAVRSSEVNANAELDLIGRCQLRPGGPGAWGSTHLVFWGLANHTIGGTKSTSDFSNAAGLLWDTNDGDAPDPDWLLGLFAVQQEFTTRPAGNSSPACGSS